MVHKLLIAAVLLAGSAGAAPAQDVVAGEISFRKCLPCHAVGAGARNKFGPQLNGLDGRRSGTAAGYTYSDSYRSSGIVWNQETFAAYINDPKETFPGSKMTFRGIKDATEVRNLWAYLSGFDSDGSRKPEQGGAGSD